MIVRSGEFGVRSGFTFVELLIAATMMSILFVGLGAHLRGGLEVWRQATTRGESLQQRRIALDRLERDLANAVVYDDREEAYGADAGKLPTPVFGNDALAWFTVERPSEGLATVRAVAYRCDAVDGVSGLWRTSQSIAEARMNRDPSPQLLLPGCERLSVRYGRTEGSETERLVWSQMSSADTLALPGLIELTLALGSGERLTRVCAIPAGTVTPSSSP